MRLVSVLFTFGPTDGLTDGPTDRQADRWLDTTSYKDATAHLKTVKGDKFLISFSKAPGVLTRNNTVFLFFYLLTLLLNRKSCNDELGGT